MGIVRILQILHSIGLHKGGRESLFHQFHDGKTVHLVLRTDNGPQYISHEFKESMELLGIRLEYIQKPRPKTLIRIYFYFFITYIPNSSIYTLYK